jgi:serine/arginine repetitive matrix protein 1
VYPALADTGDDSLADAIPTWTQPKVRGDWDDVVLPAVAKKQGMQEQYEMADGSPKPKPVKTVIEPAPGTFGFDYSKYKPPRDHEAGQIPMDEFGQQAADASPPADTSSSPPTPAPTQQPFYPPEPAPKPQQQPSPRRPMSPRSESPLAFAAYGEMTQQQQQPTQEERQPPKSPLQNIPPPEREEEVGCCAKCIIM